MGRGERIKHYDGVILFLKERGGIEAILPPPFKLFFLASTCGSR